MEIQKRFARRLCKHLVEPQFSGILPGQKFCAATAILAGKEQGQAGGGETLLIAAKWQAELHLICSNCALVS